MTVTETIAQKVNASVSYLYDPNLEAYSAIICFTCQINPYLLDLDTNDSRKKTSASMLNL